MLLLRLKYLNSLLIVIVVTNAKKKIAPNITLQMFLHTQSVHENALHKRCHLTETYTVGRSALDSSAHTNIRTKTDWIRTSKTHCNA